MIKREIQYFFTAIMFFTRIPVPVIKDYSEEYLNKSLKYFPLIGWIVGGSSAIIYYSLQFIFPLSISIILSMVFSILLTGAFHEDGFADVCDSFGGGYTKEKILKIMKDSRIGAYGAIGIVLILFLKFYLLYEIAEYDKKFLILMIINGHVISRYLALNYIQTHNYVSDIDTSKSKPIGRAKLSIIENLISILFLIFPIIFIKNPYFLISFPIAYLSKIYLSNYFKKHIGGYTGDCLGATQQVSEVVFYLSILGIWKFI